LCKRQLSDQCARKSDNCFFHDDASFFCC
jgi:hypothetical protein